MCVCACVRWWVCVEGDGCIRPVGSAARGTFPGEGERALGKVRARTKAISKVMAVMVPHLPMTRPLVPLCLLPLLLLMLLPLLLTLVAVRLVLRALLLPSPAHWKALEGWLAGWLVQLSARRLLPSAGPDA